MVVVTGANGFIGRNLVEKLSAVNSFSHEFLSLEQGVEKYLNYLESSS